MPDAAELLERQKALGNFGDFVLDHEDLQKILDEASRIVAEALNADLAKVLEIERTNDTALVRAGVGWREGIVGKERVSLGERSSEAFAIAQGKPVIANDIARETRFHFPEFLTEHGVVALVNVPIFLPGRKPWGLLQVDAREAREFEDEDIEFLKTYAMVLGPVIDRLQKVAVLQESEGRLRVITANLPVMIGYYDRELRYAWINEQYSRFHGVPLEQIQGQKLEEFLAPKTFARLKPYIERAFAGERVTFEDREPDKLGAGRDGWTEETYIPHFDEDGKIAGIFVLVVNTTERHQAEASLRESEERFRQFGDASSDLLWIRDAESLAFEYLSPAFEKLYGAPREQVLQDSHVKGWLELIHADDRENALKAMRKLRDGEPVMHEFRVLRPDGSLRWVHNTDFPMFDEFGKVQRIAGIASDITEEKRTLGLQATLVAELQHRVRNILAMIRSVVRRTSSSKKDLDDFVHHLQGRIDAMARTQTLLTRIPGQGVDLEEVVRDELISQAAAEQKAAVYGPPTGLSPHAAELVTLAIHELATNSVKYGALGQSDGQVTVSWECLGDDGNQRLELTWHETGLSNEGPKTAGFGTELITQRVPYELRGRGELKMANSTLTATIEFPLEPGFGILETQPTPWTGKLQ